MHKEYRVVLQITQTAQSDKQGNYGTWLNCKHIAVSDHKDLQNHRNRNQLSQHGNWALSDQIDSIDDQSVQCMHCL